MDPRRKDRVHRLQDYSERSSRNERGRERHDAGGRSGNREYSRFHGYDRDRETHQRHRSCSASPDRSRKTSRARSKSKRKSGFYMGPPTAATVTGSVGQLTDVGGLPPLANKQTIATFFSQVKTSIGGTSAESGRCYHWKHTRAMKKKGSLSCTFSSRFGNYAGGFGASSTLMV